MTVVAKSITSCLWFDGRAEEAARFYVSVFGDGRLGKITHYGEAGHEIHGHEAGEVLTVAFEVAGQAFVALNGGPQFTFNEAVSFQVMCETQAEVDHFWSRLSEGGEEGPCGWLKDRFGLSWQVVPTMLIDILTGTDRAAAERVTAAFLKMSKFDIAALERARRGEGGG